MKRIYYFSSVLLLAIFSLVIFSNFSTLQKTPPLAPQGLVTEEICGITVEDHYRNLENLEDEEVKNWLKEQNEYAESSLSSIPKRQYLIDKQIEFDKRQVGTVRMIMVSNDEHYFYLKRLGDEDVERLFYRNGYSGEEELLFDPKDYRPELEKKFVINYHNPDWNAEKIVISFTESGKEVSEMVILDLKTRKLLPDLITNARPADGPGVSWLEDNSSFIYLHYPGADPDSGPLFENTKSVCHKIGQDSNILNEVLSKTNNPELNLKSQDFPVITLREEDHDYIIAEIAGATSFVDMYYATTTKTTPQRYDWKFLCSKDEKVRSYVIKDNNFIYLTGKDASNYKICQISLENPNFNKPTVLVEENLDEVIQRMTITADGLFYVTSKNGVEGKLYYHIENGKDKQIELPNISGNVYLASKGEKYSDLWVTTIGWSTNFKRYRYDVKTNEFEVADLIPNADFPEFEDIEIKEVLVKSHDGEEVPLSLVYKKGLKMDGKNPVIIYGHGSYGGSISPFFSSSDLLFTLEGGIFAVAHVRGGGEKGVEWHQGGRKTTKPNTWKDLIACTEYLIEENYTSNKHTAIWSFSAGGILVGRAMTERPDLFAVVIAEVGVMNPLRFEHTPNGKNNVKEFGTVKNEEECKALFEMDAYLHIEKGVDYPATLVTSGINDTRVSAWQPAKFAAKLQAYQNAPEPIYFLVDFEGGHRFGGSRTKFHESHADIFAFTFNQTGHPEYQRKTIFTQK